MIKIARTRQPPPQRARRFGRTWSRRFSRSPRVTITYEYDALHRRIQRGFEDSGESLTDPGEELMLQTIVTGGSISVTDFYHTTSWQVIEDRVDSNITAQYVWSKRYVNAPVLRDRDVDGQSGLEERLYFQSDANFNTTALIETDGDVVERVVTDSYGGRTFLGASWTGASGISTYSNDILFQGGRQDVTTGLVNFQIRDLSTGLGRWVQQDPGGYVDGLNL